MQAVILAAGLGTRMGDLTKAKQKVLLKVGDSDYSILEHDLQNLPDEVDEVFIVVGFKAEQIKELIGNEYEGKKVFYIEQKELKGTGHAISLLKDRLKGRFLVIHGDDLYKKTDLENLLRNPLAVLVWELTEDDLIDQFQAPIDVDEKGNAVKITERQPAKKGMLVNTGAYVMDERYFDYPMVAAGIPKGEHGLPQTFIQMADKGIKVVKASDWHKVTSAEDLKG